MALLSRMSPLDIQAAAQKVLELRLGTGALKCGLLAAGIFPLAMIFAVIVFIFIRKSKKNA